MQVFLVSLVGLAIVLYDGVPLARARKWKELILFAVVLALGLGLALLQALHIPISSPAKGIMRLVKLVAGG
ncbi:MAG: hypothetical protein AB1700_08100 [Bacillota bacterium]